MKPTKIARNLVFITALSSCGLAAAADSLFDFGIGAHSEDFHWNIAGSLDGTSPNILSELTWRNVNVVKFFFNSDTRTERGLRIQSHLAYGTIEDAQVRDSDYLGDDRTSEFSRSISDSEGDRTIDLKISVGLELPITNTRSTTLTPYVGFGHHESDFEITNGFQAIDTFGGTAGSALSGLNSTYDTEWQTTFLGLQVDHIHQKWQFFGRWEYHDLDYQARANWNLRTDLAHPVSFIHDSDGAGPLYTLGVRRSFGANWALYMNYSWWRWDADNGSDTVFPAAGPAVRTQLNTAVSDGNTLFIGLTYNSSSSTPQLARH